MGGLYENLRSMIFLEDPLGFTINMAILSLFAVGCLDVLRALKNLALEGRLIEQVRSKLQDEGGKGLKGAVAETLKFLGVSERSLLGRRVARVMRLRASGLSHRDVLQQLSAERIEGYGALARYIGVTLTLLGLLGTVFGMSLALFKIQGALAGLNDIAGLRALVAALGETLQGMKTAFGCTMAGLLTAILLSYLNYQVRRRQSGLIQALEEFVVCDLLPVLQHVNPDADNAARAFAEVLTSAAGELSAVQGTVAAAAAGFKDASGVFAGTAAALQGAGQSFGQSAAQVLGQQQAFTAALQETQQALKAMTEAVSKQYADMSAFTASADELLNRRLAAVEEGARSNRALLEDLQNLTAGFNASVLGYHEQFMESARGMFAEFKETLNQTLGEVNGQYKDSIIGHLKGSQKGFEEALARHESKLQSLIEQNRAGLSEFFGAQRAALHDFADMLVDVKLNFSPLVEGLDGNNSNGHARSGTSATEGVQR